MNPPNCEPPKNVGDAGMAGPPLYPNGLGANGMVDIGGIDACAGDDIPLPGAENCAMAAR